MSDNEEMTVAAGTITAVTAAAALQPSESRLALSVMKLCLVV
jgi:hypothetical protein